MVTTRTETGPVGFIANSFSSLSLSPPLLMWAVSNTARRRDHFINADHFTVHVLRGDHDLICKGFTSRSDAFDGLDVSINGRGTPVLSDCLARFDCSRYATYPGGDHQIILGEIEAFQHNRGSGLVYHQGGYHKLGSDKS